MLYCPLFLTEKNRHCSALKLFTWIDMNYKVTSNTLAFKSFSFVSKTAKNVLKGGEYLTIPLNAVKHRYFMVSTNGEYFVKLSRILTCASVFLYFDVAQYFHIWRQTMRRQLPCSLYSPLYWTSAEFTVIFGFVKIETWSFYKSWAPVVWTIKHWITLIGWTSFTRC